MGTLTEVRRLILTVGGIIPHAGNSGLFVRWVKSTCMHTVIALS